MKTQDSNGRTPFHMASLGGEVEISWILLRHKADQNALNNGSRTPLHLVLRGYIDVTVLLEHGIYVNIQPQCSSAKRQIRFRVSAGFYWFLGFRKPGNLETRKLASHVEMTSGMLTTTRKLMQLLTSNKLMGMMINKMVYKEGIEALQSIVMRKTIRHPSGTINR